MEAAVAFNVRGKGRVGERAEVGGGRRHGDKICTMKEMHLVHQGTREANRRGNGRHSRTVRGWVSGIIYICTHR